MAPRATPPVEPTPPWIAWRGPILVAIASLWIVLFLRFAMTQPLSNYRDLNGAPEDRISLFFVLPYASTLFTDPGEMPHGWRFFPERFDLIAIAAVIVLGAWSIGRLLCRMLRLDFEDRWEHLAISAGLGFSIWSLLTLALGLLGQLNRLSFLCLLLGVMVTEVVLTLRAPRPPKISTPDTAPRWLRNTVLVLGALFIGRALLGAMLPPIDFDVREYHLGGPKEWFLAGSIHFLPHNVYTSFPFLTEMLSLSAMVLHGDWFRGALAGQLVLATFYPLSSLSVFVTARRVFGATAAWLALLIFATTPWSFRIAQIAYAEGGLTCYVILSFLTWTRIFSTPASVRWRWILATGLLAGSAMACKYPGVVQVVIPIGLAILFQTFRQKPVIPAEAAASVPTTFPWRAILHAGVIYSVGVLFAVGPWLLKNTVETGNPVYPLMWTLFGGADWDAELNAKWRAGHSPTDFSAASLLAGAREVALTNDWQSVLVFAFLPLACLSASRRSVAGPAIYLAWLFLAWWGLTHRIDRFWVPLLPIACLLAGAGAAWLGSHGPTANPPISESARLAWRTLSGGLIAFTLIFNGLFITTPLIGNPHVLAKLDAAAQAVENPNMAILNQALPAGAKVLLVGEADIFDARFPLRFNTVFDKSLFEEWTSDATSDAPHVDRPFRPTPEIRAKLQEEGITHIFVNWREILRYRTTYGYTEYVTPARFESLIAQGVLAPAALDRVFPWESLADDAQRREATEHFPQLISGTGDQRRIITAQLFPVISSE